MSAGLGSSAFYGMGAPASAGGDQALALLLLKGSLDPDSRALGSWQENTSPCQGWVGIACTSSGQVTRLCAPQQSPNLGTYVRSVLRKYGCLCGKPRLLMPQSVRKGVSCNTAYHRRFICLYEWIGIFFHALLLDKQYTQNSFTSISFSEVRVLWSSHAPLYCRSVVVAKSNVHQYTYGGAWGTGCRGRE